MLLKKIVALAALAACFQSAQADVVWNWSFGGESGQFVTDGSGGGAGTYTLIDFSVTSSAIGGAIGSLSGGQYVYGMFSTDDPFSFVYDGTAVTQWLHSGGNTFDWWAFDSPVSPISYFFGWDTGNVNDATKAAWWTGNEVGNHEASTVTVSVANEVPEPAPLALLALGLAALALQTRRRA